MSRSFRSAAGALLLAVLPTCQSLPWELQEPSAAEQSCRELIFNNRTTLVLAEPRPESESVASHCYVKGLAAGSITYHVQLPFPDAWNGRLVHRGDGGSDGDLDFSDDWVARGYAVVNSNTGHDVGAAGAAYGFHDDRASEDFAYRAVHLATNAAKTVVEAYYQQEQDFAYHVGCSTGGRQGLVAAQMFPYDFDGIVAGAAAHRQFERMAHRVALQQHLFADDFAANLAFDADGDGKAESLSKVDILADAVLARCDEADGIEDGIVEPPLCDFDVAAALPSCPDGEDAADCFTAEQIGGVEHIYSGSRNSAGELVYPGAPIGSESYWSGVYIPHAGNDFVPYTLRSAAAVLAYAFYRDDPGWLPPDLADVDYPLARNSRLPEWGWWEFDIDDVGADTMSEVGYLLSATDSDIERYLIHQGGKLLMYHGWADAVIAPEPSLDYHTNVVHTVFEGDQVAAAEHFRLFMAPGVGHCAGGVGPDQADYLGALDAWVSQGRAPDTIVARHATDGVVDNERPLCPYPKRAVYMGSDGANEPRHWVATNFVCR